MNSAYVLFSSPAPQRLRKLFRFQTQAILALAALILLMLVPAGIHAQEMKLLTPTTGWVSRFNHLYWTTNSGSNWADITPVPPGVVRAGVKIRSVYFLNAQEGWVVVSHPETVLPMTPQALRNRKTLYQIAQTADGGETWSFLPLTYPALSPDEEAGRSGPGNVYFLDSLHGWLVMAFDGNSDPGRLLVTEDGGRNWTWQHGVGFSGTIRFTSLKDGWFLGGPYKQLFVTHDSGTTWHEIQLPAPAQVGAATDATFQALPAFSNSEDGFVAVHFSGRGGTASKLVIYSTRDAGKTWEPAKVLPEGRVFWQGVRFPFAITGSTLVVATGSKTLGVGRVPLTGQMESNVAASRTGALALSFADTSDGWALSVEGKLLATADGGETWKNITPWHTFTPSTKLPVPPATQPQG